MLVVPISALNQNFKKGGYKFNYPYLKPNEIKNASINCEKIYEKAIKNLSKDLNYIHQLDWPVRSWKILIGPWLARFIETTYEKWGVVKKIKKNTNLTLIAPKENYDFHSFDMENFANKTQSVYWNAQILSYLIRKYTNLNVKEEKEISKKNHSQKININTFLLKFFFINTFKFFNLFQKKNDGVIYSSYISGIVNKINLSFKLNQVPQVYSYHYYEKKINELKEKKNKYLSQKKYTENLRENLKFKISSGIDNTLDLILQDLLKKMLPSIYLENFKYLKLLTYKNIFPSYPKFILTSCAPIIKDEIFKCWVSTKIQNKTKLHIMQHGGTYGTCYFQPTMPRHELDISDNFLSWGWGNNKKIKKVPCPLILKDKKKWNRNGKILFIFTETRNFFSTFQCDSLWGERTNHYHMDQIKFINSLPKKMINNLNFRFHPGNDLCKNFILKKVSKGNAEIIKKNIINHQNFSKIMSKHRLLIFNYNSTGFIEGMGTKRPSILFLNNSLMPFSINEKEIFNQLHKVGILHFDNKSLIKHLNKINLNVENWWESKEVIKARDKFCKKFAYYNENYLEKYLDIIRN